MIEPYPLALAAIGMVGSFIVGRLRGVPRWQLALEVVGTGPYFGGVLWGLSLSRDAGMAALAAGIGALLFTTAYYRGRTAR